MQFSTLLPLLRVHLPHVLLDAHHEVGIVDHLLHKLPDGHQLLQLSCLHRDEGLDRADDRADMAAVGSV